MSDTAGTIQTTLLQVARLLDPLQRELAADRAPATLAELGILVTPTQTVALAGSLQTIAGNTKDLLQLSAQLTAAIEAENVGDVIAKSSGIIDGISKTIKGIDDLKAAVGGLGSIPSDTVNELPERLLNLLMVKALNSAVGVNELLELLGILKREHHNQGSVDPNNPPFTISTFDFELIGQWLTSPADQLRSIYKWGDPTFDGGELLDRLESLLLKLGVPAFFDAAAVPPKLDVTIVEIKAKTDIDPKGLSIALRQSINPGPIVIAVQDLKFEIKIDFKLPFDTELIIQPDGRFSFIPPASSGALEGDLEARLTADRTPAAQGYIVIGDPGGSRLEVRKLTAAIGGHFKSNAGRSEADVSIDGAVTGGKLLISMEKADGFLGKILDGVRLESNFDFGFGLSTTHGLVFSGSSTLQIQLPLHIDLGPIQIKALTFSIGIENENFPATISTDIKASLGPLVAVVEDIGFRVDFAFPQDHGGNAGPLDVAWRFQPPSGVGLSLNTGVVKGGGYLFFDFDKEEYAGILELAVMDIVTVKATGLITTRMPDGSKGFSLLIIITAEFSGIQLGFGFTLTALGGLLGLNRTMQLEVIATGVRTGGINSIMFPKDIVANAPRIISDLRAYFPPQEGRFVIGLMAKIGWGTPTLASLSLGVIVEIPPGKLAILGILKVALPAEDAPLIVIQVNFIGAIEPDKERLWFFAELFESRVLFIPIEGGMGLLVAWGENANFVLSVGGFHPCFNPPPLPFPVPKPLALDILNTPLQRIRVEAYFAVTSNTVQFGARAELRLGLDEIEIRGHLAFHALFQFSPFYFIIEISGSVELKVFGLGLFSIRLELSLEGPTPWRAKGTGTLSLLFFDISADFDITWGDKEDTTLTPIEVLPLLVTEFNKTENWRAELPQGNSLLVSLRSIEETPGLVLHPVGTLIISQRGVPLDLDIAKIGSKKVADAKHFTVKSTTNGLGKKGDHQEQFALGQFLDLDNAGKLSRKAYEKQHSGLELSAVGIQMVASRAVKRIVRYEMIVFDSKYKKQLFQFFIYAGTLFTHFLRGNAAARSPLSRATEKMFVPFEEKVKVQQEGYVVATNFDNKPVAASKMLFESEATAYDFMNAQASTNPGLGEMLHVIPAHEAVMN